MNASARRFALLAAISGAVAVGLGAFGAHGLEQHLTPDRIAIFETGSEYHFYHTLALLAVALWLRHDQQRWLHIAGRLFWSGILLFSGSLYLLACKPLFSIDITWVAFVTPIGGLLFVAGWVALVYVAYTSTTQTQIARD